MIDVTAQAGADDQGDGKSGAEAPVDIGTTIELRVHGVGVQTAADLLGVDPGSRTLPLAGDPTGAEHRVRVRDNSEHPKWDPNVHAFMWDDLTSSSPFQALWPVLLPFTLLNLAGWMHPRAVDGSKRPTIVRGTVLVLGYTMTAAWGLWLAVLVGYAKDLPGDLLPAPWWAIALGPIALVLALVGLRWIARRGVASELPSKQTREPLETDQKHRSVVGAVVAVAVGFALTVGLSVKLGWNERTVITVLAGVAATFGIVYIALFTRMDFESHTPAVDGPSATAGSTPRWDAESLADVAFFRRERELKVFPWSHVFVLLVLFTAGVIGLDSTVAWSPRLFDKIDVHVVGSATSVALIAVGLLQFVGLVVLYLASFDPSLDDDRMRFQHFPAASAAGLAILLGNGVFAGFALWLRQRPDAPASSAPELAMLDVFAAGAIAFILLAISTALAIIVPWPNDETERAMRFARLPRHLDLPISVSVAATWAAVAVVFVVRLCNGDFAQPMESPLFTLAEWALPLAAIAALGFVQTALRSLSARQQLGVAWDVLTFMPRRFHPLGVRPYSEKIVPQLQDVLRVDLATHKGVVISAHSQGTVITYAALSGYQLRIPERRALESIALVTYGSNLLRLFSRLFPNYFDPEANWLITNGTAASAVDVHRWRNFFHRTDPIGQDVFTVPDYVWPLDAPLTGDDNLLPDPVRVPSEPSDRDPAGDQTRQPAEGLVVHSHYRREAAIKAAIRALREELASST